MSEIDTLCRAFPVNVQKVVVASTSNTYSFAQKSVMVLTCAIEAAILFNTDLVSNL